MLTKTDLAEIKKLIKDLPTKIDVEKAILENNHRLFKVLATKEDISRIYVTQDKHRDDINELQKIMDKTYGIAKRFDDERNIFSTKIKNHESRLTKIESHLFAN